MQVRLLGSSPDEPRERQYASSYLINGCVAVDAGTLGFVGSPAGQAKVDAAQANGHWTALDSTDRLEVPDDLAAALAATPKARAQFDAFPATAKKGVLEWVRQAKRPETRARRIADAARMAAANERMNGTSPKAARRD